MWDEQENETEDDVQHLTEVIEQACLDLDTLWRLAEPVIARTAEGNLHRAISSNYYRVCDALRHSNEWLQRMPRSASDGTSVWEPEPAVTNEAEAPNDQVDGRAPSDARISRGGEERDIVRDPPGTLRFTDEDGVSHLALRETPEEASRRRKAQEKRQEAKRLADLRRRKAPRRKK